jgi:hypothetical protein
MPRPPGQDPHSPPDVAASLPSGQEPWRDHTVDGAVGEESRISTLPPSGACWRTSKDLPTTRAPPEVAPSYICCTVKRPRGTVGRCCCGQRSHPIVTPIPLIDTWCCGGAAKPSPITQGV